MIQLKTIFTSNIPIDCHILKGRLETDGFNCFVFDENFVCVNPFKAVAIGGVKLKVPSDQTEDAEKTINLIKQGKLIDENGEYEISSVLENDINRQIVILDIKYRIRKATSLLDKPDNIKSVWLNNDEIDELIDSEKKFQELSNIKFSFSWRKFCFELFDFDRSIFKYLRVRPVEFYIDKELVENYNSSDKSETNTICPRCKSENVRYGYAMDYKWDVLYLILSFLIFIPFPLIRKKHHCFNCGFDFKKRNGLHQTNRPSCGLQDPT
jgi:hypothetical protein